MEAPAWNAIEVLQEIADLKKRVAALEKAQVRHYVAITGTANILGQPSTEVASTS